MTYVTKGQRVRVSALFAYPTALAGAGLKFGAKLREFDGVVRHVRGDHPVTPTKIRAWIEPDAPVDGATVEYCDKCGVNEIVVDPGSIVAVLP